MPRKAVEKFYAVRVGAVPGIYKTWDMCKAQVDKFPGCVFKSFESLVEAQAFMKASNSKTTKKSNKSPRTGIAPKSPRTGKSTQVKVPIKLGEKDTWLDGALVAYCDGSCRKNGQKKSRAGVGVWFGDKSQINVSEPLQGPKQTNQRAELMAAIKCIEQVNTHYGKHVDILLMSDSQYTINCITKWIKAWQLNGWRTQSGTEVINYDLIIQLDQLYRSREGKVKLQYVSGHSGDYGNDQADKLATAGADQIRAETFSAGSDTETSDEFEDELPEENSDENSDPEEEDTLSIKKIQGKNSVKKIQDKNLEEEKKIIRTAKKSYSDDVSSDEKTKKRKNRDSEEESNSESEKGKKKSPPRSPKSQPKKHIVRSPRKAKT